MVSTIMHPAVIFLTVCISSIALTADAALPSDEQRVINSLLTDYNPSARPANPNNTVNVTFGIEIVQLVNVNDRAQMITINAWIRQIWKNDLISWDPAKFGGIKSVRLNAKSLWIPDIVLYNSAGNEFSGGTEKYKTPVIVDADGTNKWYCPGSFTCTCKIDVQFFPFDQQICKLKFGSWTFDVTELDMYGENAPETTSKYVQSAEWELIKAEKVRSAEKYTCCVHKLADVTLVLTIERKPLFYVFNLVLPCLIIVAMVLLGFFLPPESGERITLSITVLLAMAVFLQLVGESLPRNSDSIPVLGMFYIVIMGEISISLILTCWVLNIHYRGTGGSTTEVPMWARVMVMQWLGYILCVARPNASKYEHEPEIRRKGHVTEYAYDYQVNFLPSPSCHCNRCTSVRNAFHTLTSPDEAKIPDRRYSDYSSPDEYISEKRHKQTEQKMSEDLRVLANDVREREVIEQNQEDWKYFAMVMDRLFFWLYVTTIMISTLSIFLQIPPRSSKIF